MNTGSAGDERMAANRSLAARWLAQRGKIFSYVFGVGLLGAVVAPAFRDANLDAFPFSTYPMFARPRPKPTIFFMEGLDAHGGRLRVPPRLVANEEVMQAAKIVRRAAYDGPRGVERLCRRVAERVAADPRYSNLKRVQVVSARFDAIKYFTESNEPEHRHVYGACDVGTSP